MGKAPKRIINFLFAHSFIFFLAPATSKTQQKFTERSLNMEQQFLLLKLGLSKLAIL
jgi:hypothetical protein